MKRILCLLLALCLLSVTFFACGETPATESVTEAVTDGDTETETPTDAESESESVTESESESVTESATGAALATPTGLDASEDGLITWNAVDGAEGYLVKINNDVYEVGTTSYQATSVVNNFNYSVAAKAQGFADSAYTDTKVFVGTGYKPPVPKDDIKIAITGASEVKSGKTSKFKASVTGTENTAVTWELEEGSEFASIDSKGKLSATEVKGDKLVKIVARSVADPEITASKVISLVAKPELSQAMLDQIADEDTICFEGYLNISLYSFGLFRNLEASYTSVIKTAMDGENWYAQYSDVSTGILSGLFYRNHEGNACQVGVSFMNDEMYSEMLDDEGQFISWEDSGMYNNFKGLRVSDFTFNEDTWRWAYNGKNKDLVRRMVASADPYDFDPVNFELLVEDGEIMGIYAVSEDDYTLQEGYLAVQELFVAVAYGETVEVPRIAKYTHEDIHDSLQRAIDKMRAETNYTLDYKSVTASYYTQGYVQEGFVETITENDCYFRPYKVIYGHDSEEIRQFVEDDEYGYHKIDDTLYNAYFTNEKGKYQASRAYEADFSEAKPSFMFAAELFRSYYEDEENGTVTYYVDSLMSSVASEFYYGVGNDINLYGIFATEGYTSTTDSFTPYVTVKDDTIVEAGFYFYLGTIFGVVELKYSDFGTSALPEDVEIDFETRYVPTKWEQLIITESTGTSGTADDIDRNALEYLKEFFGDDDIADKMPFFGDPLGDTYGFGLTTYRIPTGTHTAVLTIGFYYDVPLDTDYTIDSSLRKIENYLLSLGFEKNANDEFRKDGMVILPMDSSLDLMIYVWREEN